MLERYIQAWESADINGIVALLREDATFVMPPSPSWFRGQSDIRTLLSTIIMAGDQFGLWRLLPVQVNGGNGFALYHRDNAQSKYQAYAIQTVTLDGEFVSGTTTFLYPMLFSFFNLPADLK